MLRRLAGPKAKITKRSGGNMLAAAPGLGTDSGLSVAKPR